MTDTTDNDNTPGGAERLHEVQLRSRVYERDGLKAAPTRAARDGLEPERAVAIKAIFRDDRSLEDPFAEIVSLAETAGARVVGRFAQNLQRPHARTYIGKGKVEEIASQLDDLGADFVVADNDLSPAQERNLENAFKRKVVDRSQLILDIFARRASTLQAKLQVELAQLRYTLPRLKRMWTHLERFEGGIGMRGPGETQLETDKRIIQQRIQKLQRRLDDIERRHQVALDRRPEDFGIALVGYTNVGKSTLLNRLTESQEFVEDKLFATLDTRTRKWSVDSNRHVMVKDTVGFIRNLPHHLVASFHATLAETQQADLLFHVVDASSPEAERQIRAVVDVLKTLECHEKPTWLVLNKWDRVAPDRRPEALRLGEIGVNVERVATISAATGEGVDELRAAVVERLERQHQAYELVVPHERGDLFAFIQRNGKILAQETRSDGTHFEFEMAPVRAAKLRSLYPDGFDAPPRDEDL